MARRRKKSPALFLGVFLILCIAAGIYYLGTQLFASPEMTAPETTQQDAESCRAKITKMLIDETLAFNYQKTKDVPFSEKEINSWLADKLGSDRVLAVQVKIGNEDIVFAGLLNPFLEKKAADKPENVLEKSVQRATVAFRIETRPVVRSNRIFFEPQKILFGKLQIPPKFMPELPNALGLNPFEKQIRTIKDVHLADGSLMVTVYAD